MLLLSVALCVLCVGLGLPLWHFNRQLSEVLIAFKHLPTIEPIDLKEIKEELGDIVHDVVANLQPPSAVDHLFGAIAQVIQVKAMKGMGLSAGNAVLNENDED